MVCANAVSLAAIAALVGPVPLDFTSSAAPVRSSAQPPGAAERQREVARRIELPVVGQFAALIESVPVVAISVDDREIAPAVRDGTIEVAGLEACVPGAPARSHVASIPVNGVAHVPEPEPEPEPVIVVVQTALPLAGTTQW